MKYNRRLSIRLDSESEHLLAEIASIYKLSKSDVVRTLVHAFWKTEVFNKLKSSK